MSSATQFPLTFADLDLLSTAVDHSLRTIRLHPVLEAKSVEFFNCTYDYNLTCIFLHIEYIGSELGVDAQKKARVRAEYIKKKKMRHTRLTYRGECT